MRRNKAPPTPPEPVQLPLAVDLEADEDVAAVVRGTRRGPGRPPGARNRRTMDFAVALELAGSDKLAVARWTTDHLFADTVRLAKVLGCPAIDVHRLKVDLAKTMLDRLFPRLAALQVDANVRELSLRLDAVPIPGAANDVRHPIFAEMEMARNQQLSSPAPEAVGNEPSETGAGPMENSEMGDGDR